jgi:FKBP-type peptidyl-prolyl cis-trans isomerase FklB
MKRLILTLIALPAILLVSQVFALSLDNKAEQLSYAIGVQTGKAFKEHKVAINSAAFSAGLDDAVHDKTLKISEKKMATVLAAFRQQSLAKLQSHIKQSALNNEKRGASFLAKNKRQTGVKITQSGLQYKIITQGRGKTPTAKSMVTVNYEGRLINGKVFDSSYKRGKPVTFPVGGVIAGWQEALKLMKPGATWMLYIPPELAYGLQGVPGAIGPNETLIFKVNLISVKR